MRRKRGMNGGITTTTSSKWIILNSTDVQEIFKKREVSCSGVSTDGENYEEVYWESVNE